MTDAQAVILRDAVAADADALAALHVTAWQWAYRGQLPDAMLDGLSASLRADGWRRSLTDPHDPTRVRVAVVDLEIVGFCSWGPSRDPDSDPRTGEVWAIYLAREQVGTGVEALLFRGALEDLRERQFTEVRVWVLDSNERGRDFYRRMGLEPDGATKVEQRGDTALPSIRYAAQF